jgi:hypothetical protein
MDRSLKDEMRAAVQGDRERAEARRKAEEEGEYTGPSPTLDLNKPTREWKLPAKPAAEEAEVPQPELVPEESPEPELVPEESPEPELVPEESPEPELVPEEPPKPKPEPEPEPEPPSSLGFLERLQGLFRRT